MLSGIVGGYGLRLAVAPLGVSPSIFL